MKSLRRIAGFALAPVAAVGIVTAVATPSEAASFTCPSSKNPSTLTAVSSPRTAQVTTGGQTFKVELRYSSSSRYAWGRVTMLAPSSSTAKAYHIWTDRQKSSSAEGQMCQVNRDGGFLRSGGQDWTSAISDAGYVMRACFKLRDYAAVTCTGWY
jgi:hypothetical protein